MSSLIYFLFLDLPLIYISDIFATLKNFCFCSIVILLYYCFTLLKLYHFFELWKTQLYGILSVVIPTGQVF